MPALERQCADCVLMVRPARFGANPETADSNRSLLPVFVG